MEENGHSDREPGGSKWAIGSSMGCLAIIVMFTFGIAVALIIVYLKSILGGGKEFFLH